MKLTPSFSGAATATIAILMAVPGPALAQSVDGSLAGQATESRLHFAERTAGDIITQPIRDAGLMSVDIPDPLVRATIDPYALPDDASCAEVRSEIGALSGVLGSDLVADEVPGRPGRQAGGGRRTSGGELLIPFRTFVREVTGAAPAQRRFQAAVDLGYARRGFLRAVYRLRNCPADVHAAGAPGSLTLSLVDPPRP